MKGLVPILIRLFGDPEVAPFPWFAEEQLSHATYVYLGDRPCTEKTLLEALSDGRTCVTRGGVEFEDFVPAPSFSKISQIPVQIYLKLPKSYSSPRPRTAIVFRDGTPVHWEPYSIVEPSLEFTYVDPSPPPGKHVYQVYVPSKFLSSPITFEG